MKDEISHGNTTPFSMDLMISIKSSLINSKQTMLFLNRRGFSNYVSCQDCGHTIFCDKCDVSMVYHKKNNFLKCHYCGHTKAMPKYCPKCGSKNIKQFGLGTEKLEEITKTDFPDLKVIRIDSDTTKSNIDYINNMKLIENKDVNLIIGTQMITKGFDYPDIETVGIVSADMSLNIPNYTSAEKTFQLLMQVAGRAGRKDSKGNVIIQTYNPDHYAIKSVENHDYESFFKEELLLRKTFSYPPFKRQYAVTLLNPNISDGLEHINKLYSSLEKNIRDQKLEEDVEFITSIKNPFITRINNRFHISFYITSSIKREKNVKKILYDVLIANIDKINLKNSHIDVVTR